MQTRFQKLAGLFSFRSFERVLVSCAVVFFAVFSTAAQGATPPPLLAAHGAVASDNPQASDVGVAILKSGGNAIDAACATALALGVTHPYASGMGGGGFAIVYLAKERRVLALDFRERAPAGIRPELFLKDGKADPKLSREGGLAVAVPGEVRGLGDLVRRFGKLPFARCVAPAEALARNGMTVTWRLAEVVSKETAPAIQSRFSSGGKPVEAGATLRRPDLAWTLSRLRTGGPEAFYKGAIANEIVKAVKDAGGVLTLADLEAYRATERAPMETTYRGLRVVSMPPPSSGGIALVESLGILSARFPRSDDLRTLGHGSSAYLHVLAEILKHAFADRARFLGDPDFVTVPSQHLQSPEYAAQLAAKIHDRSVLPREAYGTPEGTGDVHRDGGTAHLSVVDAEGNAVSMTTTINLGFGAKVIAGKTGIVLNNQMDDFAIQPGVPNGFGLIGSTQNAVAPGKRPLSSMTPTLVIDEAGVKVIVGAAGGPNIITATLQVLLNVVDWNLNAQAAIAAPRIHDQWVPEFLMVEPEISRDVVDALIARGQVVKPIPHVGVSNLVVRGTHGWEVAAEPRSPSRPAGY